MSPRLAFPALLLGSATLAFGPLLVRIADVGATQSAFWRLAVALPPMLLLARLTRAPLPGRALLWPAVVGGLWFALDLIVWHLGIHHTRLANATLFANTSAFMLAGAVAVRTRRWPPAPALLSLGIALAGIALLLGRSAELSPANVMGDALSLAAAAFYTAYLLVVGRMRDTVAPVTVLLAVTAAACVWMLPVAALAPGAFWPHDWWPIIGLALGSQLLGQGLVTYAVGRLPPVTVGLGLLIQPVIAAALGWLRFGEALGTVELLGAAMVLAALLLVRLPNRSQREAISP